MAINEKKPDDYGYVAIYNQKRIEIYAPSKLAATDIAVAHFKPPKSQRHMVIVMLAERQDGSTVTHSTGAL